MSNRRHERGSELVEFALILPLFLFLVFTIVELGRVFQMYQTLTNAAREGARFSVAPFPGTSTLPTHDDVVAKVCTYLDAGSVHCTGGGSATVTVAQDCPNGTTDCDASLQSTFNGSPISYTQVSVAAPYSFIVLPFGSLNVRSHAVMRNETN